MLRIVTSFAVIIGCIALFAAPGQTANNSDNGLFSISSIPPDTAVYAGIRKIAVSSKHFTLNISATASGSAGTFVINFTNGASMIFQVPADTTLSTTHVLGGVPGVDNIVKITQTGGVNSMMVSVLAEVGAKDPFNETLDSATAQIDNFVVVAPSEPGSTSAATIFP